MDGIDKSQFLFSFFSRSYKDFYGHKIIDAHRLHTFSYHKKVFISDEID